MFGLFRRTCLGFDLPSVGALAGRLPLGRRSLGVGAADLICVCGCLCVSGRVHGVLTCELASVVVRRGGRSALSDSRSDSVGCLSRCAAVGVGLRVGGPVCVRGGMWTAPCMGRIRGSGLWWVVVGRWGVWLVCLWAAGRVPGGCGGMACVLVSPTFH